MRINFSRKYRLLLLGLFTLTAIAIVFMLKPIPQPLAYHNFADTRAWRGIPNFANVASNFPFLIVGIAGLLSLYKSSAPRSIITMYAVLFIAILLTGLGSAYYHYAPDNNTLVYDRIPMTIAFMALFCATIAETINARAGILLLFPLILTGIFSVVWWHITELHGKGDLRPYALIQFYPLLCIPLILMLFPSPQQKTALRCLAFSVAWYIVAKLCEQYDKEIYTALHFISGHSLKHFAAALATWYLVLLFKRKHIKYAAQSH